MWAGLTGDVDLTAHGCVSIFHFCCAAKQPSGIGGAVGIGPSLAYLGPVSRVLLAHMSNWVSMATKNSDAGENRVPQVILSHLTRGETPLFSAIGPIIGCYEPLDDVN